MINFTCGRFNPVTKGHKRIFDYLNTLGNARVYTTYSHDPIRNPLSSDDKIKFISSIFDGPIILVKNPFVCVDLLLAEGIMEATMVIGEDRDFSSLVNYADRNGLALTLEILSRTNTEAYARISATEVREAAKRNDVKVFASLTPDVSEQYTIELFNAVRIGLEING